MKNNNEASKQENGDKDNLSQQDIKSGVKNFAESDQPHAALETADGKNNGAEPAAFKNQRKSRT
jgi:hypothetical protein